MKNLYFIISALLVTSMAFSADTTDRSTIDQKGKLGLALPQLNYTDVNAIQTLGNGFTGRIGQPAMQHMYIQDLMKIPTAYSVMYLATLDMANRDPACAESMLASFIPKNNNAMSFAILATMIGEVYLNKKQQYDDAARLFITSWQIKPTQTLAHKIIGLQAKKKEYRGTVYWYEKAKKEGCPSDIHPDIIQIIAGAVNASPDQKIDLNKEIEEILSNETSEVGDLYNPEYLLFREDM